MKTPLITILTAPKPFVDPRIKIIQKNALRSWKALGGHVDVMVLGDEKGTRDICRTLGIRYFPDVRCNDKGTPLISSMLEIGRKESQSPILAIVNTDIILFQDFLNAARNVKKYNEKFLIIGQRWDMNVSKEIGESAIDFSDYRSRIANEAKLHPPMGSDYCIFPRSCFTSIPDFAIGRAGWDNWFIYKSRWEGWKVIDATHDVMVIHQSHDYSHLPYGKPHYRLPETKKNVILGGGEHTIFTLRDAQVFLQNGKLIRKSFGWKKMIREIEIFPLSNRRSQFLGRVLFYLFHPKKGYREIRKALNSK